MERVGLEVREVGVLPESPEGVAHSKELADNGEIKSGAKEPWGGMGELKLGFVMAAISARRF